jgi:GT2 family glycosyltransferase
VGTSKPRGLASIIIPSCNPVESTRQCIAALRRYTRGPWELIIADNGSDDQTAAYLAGVRAEAPIPVSVVASGRACGMPAAINQGMQAARGEHLVVLSNDVVVTEGWLEQLIGLADCRERRVGLVGPMFNHGASPQSAGAVPYHDLPSMHEFAQRWREGHRGKWFTVAQLSGACLLMRRDVYEAIGGLDEQSGSDVWAEELAMRAQRAGFGPRPVRAPRECLDRQLEASGGLVGPGAWIFRLRRRLRCGGRGGVRRRRLR